MLIVPPARCHPSVNDSTGKIAALIAPPTANPVSLKLMAKPKMRRGIQLVIVIEVAGIIGMLTMPIKITTNNNMMKELVKGNNAIIAAMLKSDNSTTFLTPYTSANQPANKL